MRNFLLSRSIFYWKRLISAVAFVWVLFGGAMSSSVFAAESINLFDFFELEVSNSGSYSNPFDYAVIELQGTLTSPSGKTYTSYGFYDGDGLGGQSGDSWKLRFMPNEVGTWSYVFSWTDSTTGGSGSFDVIDTGLPGPLRVASDKSWYFEDARGNAFHWRGYDLRALDFNAGESHVAFRGPAADDYIRVIQSHVLSRKYNFLMLQHPSSPTPPSGFDTPDFGSWWLNAEKDRFDLLVWKNFERILRFSRDNGVVVMPFNAMVTQNAKDHMSEAFVRYFAARLGAFSNYLGYSITWEYYDVFSENEIDNWMTFLREALPFEETPLLTIHDKVKPDFTAWQAFHISQGANDGIRGDVLASNDRSIDVDSALQPYDNPMIGSEDIWETPSGANGQTRNATEVRRTAWGEMLAGVLPLYSEWTEKLWRDDASKIGNGDGESEVRRMFDFFYSKTRYREYQQLNALVSASSRQVASGVPGEEYLVYDENGGSVTIDLSGASSSTTFSVLWFDPKTGSEQNGGNISGGGVRSVSPSFSGDAVLLLGGLAPDSSPPSAPSSLSALGTNTSQIDLSWFAASDLESGVNDYRVYRDGLLLTAVSGLSYSDTGLSEGTGYLYEISAVNGVNLEGSKSASVTQSTVADTLAPTLLSASAPSAFQVVVVFSEAMAADSANNASNYVINNSITVSSASLASDLKTVTLTTSPHAENLNYQLTVNNIRDRATTPNVIGSNNTAIYNFVSELVLSNLTTLSAKTYLVLPGGFDGGALVYVDRTYVFENVPDDFSGATFIRTANEDKSKTGNSFVAFDVNQAVAVYVAHDDRQTGKPEWMGNFNDARVNVTIAGNPHSLWRLDVSTGSVALGGNDVASGSMYSIIVFKLGDAPTLDLTPPEQPTGLRLD